ncbi:WD40 repeat-like protein [Hortaea werneckii]|nr:WD40 repeat-like protein [Hortaea werneckii]
MVGLRELQRTAVFAWSPGSSAPLLVTGTRTGALNDDLSSETKLELWDLGLDQLTQSGDLTPLGTLSTDAGFNDIAWSEPDDDHPLGVIAGALDNGSVDIWDAEKLRKGASDAHISRTSKHSGAAKALQWNPYRHNLLASVGAKGEIFIYDLNNMANPFRLGASAARADDIECLDWNKQEKTAHILATGSSGGFVTVWDVKQKKDILTLNNQGRKAVSGVAWDPEESTKLATATSNDQDPVVLLWSLRNSGAPERVLKGHELGVLGLSWCQQDPELLLSCGKDNRTICWNPKTGEMYGDFAAGSNWAFQTRWNPHNPSLIASASFDGKILVTSIQATNSKPEDQAASNQALDGEDFFAKAQTQPQGISFTLPKAPKWAARPVSVSFGFGGKLVRTRKGADGKSTVTVETFSVDDTIGEMAQEFEEKMRTGDLAGICENKIENAKTDEEKADWQVIETLNAGKSRKKLREYMGFNDADADLAKATEKLDVNGEAAKTNGDKGGDDDFFGTGEDDDSFLANLAATKGAKTNNPFSIYTSSESEADKSITRALMLGQFEKALDVCLKEDRMSDAFMIAVCGGQQCIDKAQAAYLKKQAKGPNYLRLLASIVGKNLWDVVHNADLENWREVMATLCTYADETEFADLCEALGDRLEEAFQDGDKSRNLRRDASFCFLAGSKLEKVVNNWVQELHEQETAALQASESDNDFSVHAKCLQSFVEKVSVFRQVTKFQDTELNAAEEWKLAPLYALYSEYADILAAHGQLNTAQQYISLLPTKFGGAEAAQSRLSQATKKSAAPVAAQRQPATAASRRQPSMAQPAQAPFQPAAPLVNQARNAPSPYAPAGTTVSPAASQSPYAPPANPYTPAGYQPPQAAPMYGGYQPPQPASTLPPPPRAGTSSPSVPPPPKASGDWNDMPANFFKERQARSRTNTPGPNPVSSPFPNAVPNTMAPPPGPPQPGFGAPPQKAPLPPPPKVGEAPPRVMSPSTVPPPPMRPTSAAANAYAPPVGSTPPSSTLPTPAMPPVQRGASPYQPPPSTSTAAPTNRYAPAPGSAPSPAPNTMPPPRQVAPNPYAAQQTSPYAPSPAAQTPYGQPPQAAAPPPSAGPPPSGPPRGPPRAGPPPGAAQTPGRPAVGGPAPPVQPLPQTAADANANTPENATPPPPPPKAKHPKGDRSHISAQAQPIVEYLSPAVAHIKSVAPQSFKPQVDDMDKRINILFDHLNNDDLLKPDTVQTMVQISECVRDKQWDQAQQMFTEMQMTKGENEGGVWMVGVKRLIAIGRATKQ